MDWLKRIHEAQSTLRDVVGDLFSLSAALSRVGNDRLSEEVLDYAKAVNRSVSEISEGLSVMTKEAMHAAQESQANLLSAILAGVIGPPRKDHVTTSGITLDGIEAMLGREEEQP